MKKVKLFFGILIGLIIISSCSNDEESNSNSTSIIGNWKISKRAYSCTSNTEQNLDLDICRKKSTISFLNNGNVILNNFSYVNNQCTLNTITGKWELGNSLKITLENTDDPTYIDFKNNILKMGYYSTDPTKVCDDNTKVSYSYIEFVKQ